jgi:hypothetical protein
LKTELKRTSERGLLLSSYNIYSQFKPRRMEVFIFELIALETAYHVGGSSNYEITKRWTELIWDVDGLIKRILAEDKLHNNPMCRKFLAALELQDEIAPRKGARQITRIYRISPTGNRHHDNGVQSWRKIDVCMFKGTTDHVLTYFKCRAGKDANEGEAGFATLKGTHAVPGHECRSFWK